MDNDSGSTPSSPPPVQDQQDQQQQKQAAAEFLQSILNKNLRVTTTDTRMFWGTFKCTDSVRSPSLKILAYPFIFDD
jgi:hypothetical protein